MGERKTDAQVRVAFRAGVAFLLFTELLALTGIAPAPHRFLTLDPNSCSPFFAYAVAGVFAIHVVYGRQAQVFAAFAIGMILAVLHAALFSGVYRHWLLVVSITSYYLGIGSCLMLAWLGWRHRDTAQGGFNISLLQTALLLPLFVNISWFYLTASSVLQPVTFDTTLYHFDASLGLQASALAAHALCSLEWSGQARRAAVIGVFLLGGWLLYLLAGASLFERVGRLHWIPIVFTVLLALRLASSVSRDVEAAASRSPLNILMGSD